MIFNIDFKDIKFQLTPHFLRKDNLLKLMFSAIKPLKTLNNDGIVVESFGQKNSSLHQFVLFINNFLNFDARTIFLEKFLNDIYAKVTERWFITTPYLIGAKIIFDGQNYIALTNNVGKQPDLNPSDWETTGIEIINDNTIRVQYIFNKAEQGDDYFLFNAWDDTFDYKINTLPVTGDFAVFENKVYQAKTDNTNKQPDLNPSDWDFFRDITFLFNFSDEFPFDYQVQIPANIEATIIINDPNFRKIKSQIKQLNAAGISFEGVRKADTTFQLFNSRT